MTKPVICLTDIHGCFYTMIRLLNQCPKPARLVFAGDEIDRGPHSRKVVEFAMQNALPIVMGNHTDLCVDFYRPEKSKCGSFYERGIWLYNGGDKAVRNWPIGPDNPARKGHFGSQDEYVGGRVPDSVLDWFEGLPAYLTPSDQLDENGRKLLVSHTGYGLEADDGGWFGALWGRHEHGDGRFPDDNYYRVYGHSIQHGGALVTERFANIDTGAAYPDDHLLSALLWPSKVVLTQPYDESQVEPTFKVVDGCIE